MPPPLALFSLQMKFNMLHYQSESGNFIDIQELPTGQKITPEVIYIKRSYDVTKFKTVGLDIRVLNETHQV